MTKDYSEETESEMEKDVSNLKDLLFPGNPKVRTEYEHELHSLWEYNDYFPTLCKDEPECQIDMLGLKLRTGDINDYGQLFDVYIQRHGPGCSEEEETFRKWEKYAWADRGIDGDTESFPNSMLGKILIGSEMTPGNIPKDKMPWRAYHIFPPFESDGDRLMIEVIQDKEKPPCFLKFIRVSFTPDKEL